MLSQVRDYIKARIAEIDPSLKEWQDAINTDNVPESLVDKSFHINISSPSVSGPSDRTIRYDIPCVVTIWRKGFREKVIEAHDYLLDNANCLILASCVSLKQNASDNIRLITPSSIVIDPIDGSNDNILKASITLNCTLFYEL